MDARQINDKLCDRIEDVVSHLFPAHVVKKGEALVGDIQGSPGESLKIVLRGSKTGFWKDFSTDQSGKTLTTLWCEARAKDCRKAFEEMHAFLGIKRMDDSAFYNRVPTLRRSIKVEDAVAIVDGSNTMGYLVSDRGLTPATLKAYRVAQGLRDDVMAFPSFEPDGKTLVHMKYIKIERENGKKVSWTSKDTSCVLFGKQAVPMDGGDLVITEGEIDAMSMYQMGYPAVSIPFGAGNHEKWIENDYEWLECFSRIVLCMDADGAGFKGRAEIAKRLGHHRCFMVNMPDGCKDANDVLLADKQAEMFDAMESASTIDPPQLKPASEFWEETREVRFPTRKDSEGVPFLFSAPWSIRPKELTIWTGFNFHGKSQLLNLTVVYLRSVNQTTCVASFEVEPPVTLDIMTCQSLAQQNASVAEYEQAFRWLTDGMMIVNRVGVIPWRELLEIMRYAALRYRVKQFVIDSMLRCGIGQEDFQSQKDLVDALTLFALEHECHVHLVAHSKKPQNSDESRPPGKYDIKGSGDISDLAHNVVCVHRNLEKQEKKEKMKGNPLSMEDVMTPDGHFHIYKQRRGGRIAKIPLFHFGASMQFQPAWNSEAKRFAPEFDLVTASANPPPMR